MKWGIIVGVFVMSLAASPVSAQLQCFAQCNEFWKFPGGGWEHVNHNSPSGSGNANCSGSGGDFSCHGTFINGSCSVHFGGQCNGNQVEDEDALALMEAAVNGEAAAMVALLMDSSIHFHMDATRRTLYLANCRGVFQARISAAKGL